MLLALAFLMDGRVASARPRPKAKGADNSRSSGSKRAKKRSSRSRTNRKKKALATTRRNQKRADRTRAREQTRQREGRRQSPGPSRPRSGMFATAIRERFGAAVAAPQTAPRRGSRSARRRSR
jgi:hypothetical protein